MLRDCGNLTCTPSAIADAAGYLFHAHLDGRSYGFHHASCPQGLTLILFIALLATAPARADILYVSNLNNNTIEKFTSGGVGSVFASSGLNQPLGLAFDSAGNLYAADNGIDTIEKFTQGGIGSVFASSGLNGPQGLAVNKVGNLYVANHHVDYSIEKFTPGGIGSVFATSGLNAPNSLAFLIARATCT